MCAASIAAEVEGVGGQPVSAQTIRRTRAVSSQFDALGKIPIAPPAKKKSFTFFFITLRPDSCHIQLVFHSNTTNLWRLSSTNLNALYVN